MSKKGYKKGKWSGLDNFACEACGYATLQEAAIKAHVKASHGKQDDDTTEPEGVTDDAGN